MAVYTTLTHQDAAGFLAQYDLGALKSCEPIAEGVTNTNYLVTVADGVKYILTLFEKHFELVELPYYIALMEWWHARGISCPRPVAMKNGRVLAALKEKPALLVSFLEGEGVREITPEHMQQLGALAANMHVTGMEFPHTRQNHLGVSDWEAIIDKIALRADEIEPGLKRLISEEYNYLSEHWPSGLPGGPIHADLFPDNVFFSKSFGKKPVLAGVIDFYFSCNDFWAYDLAIIINAWCFNARGQLREDRLEPLMAAYNNVRPISPEEEAAFGLLLRGAALRFLLTRAEAWLFPDEGALVKAKDPLEYARKLEFFQSHGA